MVLVSGDRPILCRTVTGMRVVDGDDLKSEGYRPPAEGMEPHARRYMLYSLGGRVEADNVLSSPSALVYVCSTRYVGRIDADFYSRRLPDCGGRSVPNIFRRLRPYFAKWREGWAFNPVQLDFFDGLYGADSADVPFPPPKVGKFTFIDLFAGIGGIRLGYQALGGKCVFSSEWDKNAAKTYYANFGERPHGDILATREEAGIEGDDWEQIFARCIGARWAKSNIGLDDVFLGQTAWGAKTVQNASPFDVKHVRLICGRNSPEYSYNIKNVHALEPDRLGELILNIWNGRVTDVRRRFATTRTVVLLKGKHLGTVAVYEEKAERFVVEDYYWQWNERNNLEGYEKSTDVHRFTWQPHGSQFTVVSDVPDHRLKLRIRRPPLVERADVLRSVKYDDSWIEVVS